jgi:succinate dehydrogenase hydrophobic anchor subunit
VTTFFVADTAALSSPVVLVLLIGTVLLLSVRACLGALDITLDRLVARMLDASVVLVFLLFVVFVVLRFRVVG